MVVDKNKNQLSRRAKIVITLLIWLVTLWPFIEHFLGLGETVRCLQLQNNNCSLDTLSFIVQILPILVAGFIIGFLIMSTRRQSIALRIVGATVFASVATFVALYWYTIVQFGLGG